MSAPRPLTPAAPLPPDLAKLVAMANQIATFFAAQPNAERAAAGLADHINLNWSRAMRQRLLAELPPDHPAFHPLLARAHSLICRPVPFPAP